MNNTYIRKAGREHCGENPCIHPLHMAELMTRLEQRRKQTKPGNPVALWLRNLVKR